MGSYRSRTWKAKKWRNREEEVRDDVDLMKKMKAGHGWWVGEKVAGGEFCRRLTKLKL